MTRRIAWLPVLVALASCSHASPAPVFPKLPHELFDTPIEITGAFGDHRNTHFHAGLDLATGGVVGRAVHAPIDADVVRVRASGVGYGRSLYLDTADGRTLVFGHLDAFAEPVASYVAAVQDSSGQYEQDLWPAHGRFRVHAGDVIGWTGRSGTGTPHLHVEVRRGDMAINPLLAGYAVADTTTPHIESVALYGVDDILTHADVEFGARDTVRAAVRSRAFRVFVKALDAGRSGRYDIAPWRVRVGLGPEWVQCEFDSVSWATDMAQSDFVYQAGADVMRVGGADGFRPVVVSGSSGSASGVWSVPAGQDAMLSIEAEDLAGHVTRRWVHLHGEPATRDVGPPGTLVTRESGASVELADTLVIPPARALEIDERMLKRLAALERKAKGK